MYQLKEAQKNSDDTTQLSNATQHPIETQPKGGKSTDSSFSPNCGEPSQVTFRGLNDPCAVSRSLNIAPVSMQPDIRANLRYEQILMYDLDKRSMRYAFWLTVLSCTVAYLFADAGYSTLAGTLITHGTFSATEFLRALRRRKESKKRRATCCNEP